MIPCCRYKCSRPISITPREYSATYGHHTVAYFALALPYEIVGTLCQHTGSVYMALQVCDTRIVVIVNKMWSTLLPPFCVCVTLFVLVYMHFICGLFSVLSSFTTEDLDA